MLLGQAPFEREAARVKFVSLMALLNEICGLDSDHRMFLLLVVGYPAPDAKVPDIQRKPLEQIASFL